MSDSSSDEREGTSRKSEYVSDSSSDEGDGTSGKSDYVLYRDRPDWKDVAPIPQDDGPYPVVAISYSEKFTDAYDYLRGIMKIGEKSTRALELTKDVLEMNPANYSIWQLRRDLIKHLDMNLDEELSYIENMIISQPKNYQVWHHRQVLVSWKNDPSAEFDLTATVLNGDSKNYHAWQHRQWVMSTFGLWHDELEYIDHMLKEDIRNNSAWNQRYFVILNTTGFTPEIVQSEIKYAMDKIRIVKNNESPWNYLRGIIVQTSSGNLISETSLREFCEELYAEGNRSPFLMGTIVDMCAEQIEEGGGDVALTLKRAVQLCEDLATTHDKIRREYWYYIMRRLQHRAENSNPANPQLEN